MTGGVYWTSGREGVLYALDSGAREPLARDNIVDAVVDETHLDWLDERGFVRKMPK